MDILKIKASLDEIKAYCGDCIPLPCDEKQSVYDSSYLDSRIDSIYTQLANLWETFQNHLSGHIPAIQSTEKLQHVLDVLGLSGDYEVMKKVVWAADGTKDEYLEVRNKN